MTRQEVNTEIIAAAKIKLSDVNSNINSEFHTLQGRMRRLETNWRGAAATAAHTTMHRLLKHNDARSAVIQNYINILEHQINPGYVNTESTNTSLADSFK